MIAEEGLFEDAIVHCSPSSIGLPACVFKSPSGGFCVLAKVDNMADPAKDYVPATEAGHRDRKIVSPGCSDRLLDLAQLVLGACRGCHLQQGI